MSGLFFVASTKNSTTEGTEKNTENTGGDAVDLERRIWFDERK
jgi:hypothetical protein